MVMNESVENYLETILVLNHRLGNVRSIDIANEMNFKKPGSLTVEYQEKYLQVL